MSKVVATKEVEHVSGIAYALMTPDDRGRWYREACDAAGFNIEHVMTHATNCEVDLYTAFYDYFEGRLRPVVWPDLKAPTTPAQYRALVAMGLSNTDGGGHTTETWEIPVSLMAHSYAGELQVWYDGSISIKGAVSPKLAARILKALDAKGKPAKEELSAGE